MTVLLSSNTQIDRIAVGMENATQRHYLVIALLATLVTRANSVAPAQNCK